LDYARLRSGSGVDNELGSYRAAAALCGTTDKTVNLPRYDGVLATTRM
jgi:hypothetical protein